VPKLETPSGSAGLNAIPSTPGESAQLTLPSLEKALNRSTLKKSLEALTK
jgi:hypothetical protein